MENPSDRPVAIDLFCGVGGLSLGLEQAGFDLLAAVESNPIDANAHRYNFPGCHLIERDIRDVSAGDILAVAHKAALGYGHRRWDGTIDLVCGGPPCQGFSHGGRRDISDDRNSMLFEFSRLVKELKPRYFLLENVPGLLHDRYKGIVDQLIADLGAAGYIVEQPYRLNAATCGVPQDRERIFLLGRKFGEQKSRRPRSIRGVSVADAFDGLPAQVTTRESLAISDRGRMKYGRELSRNVYGAAYPRNWRKGVIRNLDATVHSADVRRRFGKIVPGKADPISRFLRLSWEGVACTLRAGTGPDRGSHTAPRPIHPSHPRVISVREAARLHSFPDWFGFSSAKWHAWRQIGNSVPPALARRVGRSIAKALGVVPRRPTRFVALGSLRLLGVKELDSYTSDSRNTG